MPDQATASLLTLDIDRAGHVAVVRCHGNLMAGSSDLLYIPVRQLMPDAKRIVLDLTDLARVDSIGLGHAGTSVRLRARDGMHPGADQSL